MFKKNKEGHTQFYQTGSISHTRPTDKDIVNKLLEDGLIKFYQVGKHYHGWYLYGVKRE